MPSISRMPRRRFLSCRLQRRPRRHASPGHTTGLHAPVSLRVKEPGSRYVPCSNRVREERPGDDAEGNAGEREEKAGRWRRLSAGPNTTVPDRLEQTAGGETTVYVVLPETELSALRDEINACRAQAQKLSHRLLAKGPRHVRDFQRARRLREHLTRLLDWFDRAES